MKRPDLDSHRRNISQRLSEMEKGAQSQSAEVKKLFEMFQALFQMVEAIGGGSSATDAKVEALAKMVLSAAETSPTWEEFKVKCVKMKNIILDQE